MMLMPEERSESAVIGEEFSLLKEGRTHPSKAIIGRRSNLLRGRKIVLCICGSVAAVKSPEIARELMRNGAEVYAVMSRATTRIIHPHLMEWATGNPVITKLTGKVEHIALCGDVPGKADLVLVAPATANTISKIACGIDDTAVTTVVSTALGTRIPVIIAPAIHESMYRNPFVAENIEKLRKSGVIFVEPSLGEGNALLVFAGFWIMISFPAVTLSIAANSLLSGLAAEALHRSGLLSSRNSS
jgi:phosphopantothenoylcysteine decarboxylase/phosphopantothenate--cysteine ligase